MAREQILEREQRRAFDRPPHFTSAERKQYLRLTEGIRALLAKLRSPTNKICFLLNLAYFKAQKRFYTRQFYDADLRYAAQHLNVPIDAVDVATYDKESFQRHKQIIREHLGFEAYSQQAEDRVKPELQTMIRSQKRNKIIFQHLVESLIRLRIEVPSYNKLFKFITSELQIYKNHLLATVDTTLGPQQKTLLDTLLEQEVAEDKQVHRYSVTLLKRFSQSGRPNKIRENVADTELLREYYQNLETTIDALDLPPEGLRYYAQFVLNARIFQVTRRSQEDQHLHLLAFVAHQFFRGQDVLVDVFLKSTQSIHNQVIREHKEKVFEQRRNYRRSVKRLVGMVQKGLRSPLDSIESIATTPQLDAATKLEQIQDLFKLVETDRGLAEEELDLLGTKTQKMLQDAEYYDLLEAKSRKLQNRASDIIRFLDFKGKDAPLLKALGHYRNKRGSISHTAPTAFLDESQTEALLDDSSKFRVSLYKAFLFLHVAEKLKAGRLHLMHSYKYRSLDNYLIPVNKWQLNKSTYLQRAGMAEFADSKAVLAGLREALDEQYRQNNQDILDNNNLFFSPRKKGAFVLSTPRADSVTAAPLSQLFPKGHYISLVEVLHTINAQADFLTAFEHWQQRHRVGRPSDQSFFAGIMAYGCNIGIDKLLRTSRSIAEAEFETTLNWYFSLENLVAGNDKIVAFMDTMTLADVYRQQADKLHTSSDGQKFEISAESLFASYSFKYFGQGQGVSVYSFIDERNLAFYSTVISANEREVAFVIDGLMHNDVVQSDIHSTDTHGYSEVLFGVTHLLDFYFAPRIKGFAKQQLYSFERIAHYKALGYPILPDGYIDTDLIERYWDDILRFVVTIKLKEATASQLFKRLNSYAKQHPLYKALKEFGKVIKSRFMLQYISDVKLRQTVEKQLNKGELGNRFNRAISFGGSRELGFVEKDELDKADACRRLIRNAILCWNYLYLSKQLMAATPDKQAALVKSIKAGSPVAWRHINMHGEYDFSDEKMVDTIGLSSPNLVDLSQLDIWNTPDEASSLATPMN